MMAWYRKITVELPLFLVYVNYLLTGSIFTNLIIYRSCYIILGYNKTDCSQLGTETNNVTERLEKLVQPTADVIGMVKSIINYLFPIFVCMMAGPWSDKHGRKPVLLITLVGTCLSSALMAVFSYFDDLNPWYFLIALIPPIITGGTVTYLTVTLSYISDISTPETSGMRMAFFEASESSGVLLGSILSSYIFYATGYEFVFGIAAGCVLTGIIYTIFNIPESRLKNNLRNADTPQGNPLKFIIDMIRTTFKKRRNNDRAAILLLISTMVIFTFASNGDNFIQFMYLRKKLKWTLTKYTLYGGICSLLSATSTLVGTFVLHKKLKIKECNLALFGIFSVIGYYILQELAVNDLYIFLSGVVRLPGSLVSPMLRGLLAKIVPSDEIGKIFSMIMICAATLDLGAYPLYTFVYNATINTNSGIYNVISITVFGIGMVLIGIVKTLERSSGLGLGLPKNEEIRNPLTK